MTKKSIVRTTGGDDSEPRSDKKMGSGNPDARLSRSDDEDSRLTGSADRTTAEETDEDLDAAFDALVDDWSFDKLPAIPPIPGFKTIWLSTTHPQDTIPRRMRLGYTPIKPEEVPDVSFVALAQREGQYAGLIMCNEMAAYKLPERLWQRLMKRYHHDAPIEEEQGIKERVQAIRDEIQDKGGRVRMEQGTEELGRQRVPKFT